jgi:uroporphyrinogen III methyltransferase / synthase
VRATGAQLPAVAAGLRAGGMLEETPVALVADGATPRQRTAVGTLATMADDAARAGIAGEAVVVFGWPVVLRDELAWMERRPLFGRRIVVTRPEGDSALAARLRALGADVLAAPATRIEPLALDRLVEALGALDEYRFVVFTSRHAVRVVFETLRHLKRDARALAGTVVCAVGGATAAALAERGVVADVVPERFAAEGLVDALAARDDVSGARALYPAAEGARDVIPEGLLGLGADVDVVHVYRSAPAGPGADGAAPLRAALKKRDVHAVTFTSPSTVRAFVELVGAELASAAPAVTIGGVTSEAAREAGLTVAAEASPSTTDGLAAALVRLLGDGEA